MKKIKITIKASVCSVEKWLDEMADCGWILIKYCNWIYTFKKTNNRNVKYFLHLSEKNEKIDKKSIRFEITSICRGYFVDSSSLLIFCIDYNKNKEKMIELDQLRAKRNQLYCFYLIKESIFYIIGLILALFTVFVGNDLGKMFVVLFAIFTLFDLASFFWIKTK